MRRRPARSPGDDRRSIRLGRLRHRRHPDDADPEAAAAALRARPDVEYAQPRYLNHAMCAAERSALRQPVELPRHRHGARLGHPARRHVRHHRRRARQRRGVSHRARFRYNSRFAFRLTPAARSIPRSASSTCRSPRRPSSAQPARRGSSSPRDFIWDDDAAGRPRRPRHARRGHHRPAHQQRRRRRRHGLQRPHHAGEDHPGRCGTTIFASPNAAPTTSWRAASATPPTTAPR